MRIVRYISVSVALLVSFSYSAVAQTHVSDTKLMGLKGKVKSLVSSSKAISGYVEGVLKNKTRHQTTSFFDRKGDLIEKVYEGGPDEKYVYSKVDGYKTFKTIKLRPSKNSGVFGNLDSEKEEPIEPNEKLTKPDKRFNSKYVYETDDRGVIIERQYQNNGKLFRKRIYEYNAAGELIKETEEDRGVIMTYSFKYDDKGNVVEVNKTRNIKGAGSDSKERITYTDLKFDSVGNWIERKTTSYIETDPMPQY